MPGTGRGRRGSAPGRGAATGRGGAPPSGSQAARTRRPRRQWSAGRAAGRAACAGPRLAPFWLAWLPGCDVGAAAEPEPGLPAPGTRRGRRPTRAPAPSRPPAAPEAGGGRRSLGSPRGRGARGAHGTGEPENPAGPGEPEGPGDPAAAPAEAEEQAADARQKEEQDLDGETGPSSAGPVEDDGEGFSFKYSPGKLRGNQYKKMMTKEELEEEQRVQKEQLAAIFKLMKDNKETFGEMSDGDVQEQLRLYDM
ncbi:PREDICTED: matrix-remodeling-associated protein 7 [Rhinopithecus bieti]|uniref:matrix-remodeling-associated protein 7 n=1 Tax=Rhinopithecus bieti TaxID=61621 RepID=UPI00083BD68A|nr:PREDICTED: matrix-remodeling-associated protein 7 [Rhinopithecus bieti]